MNEIMRRSLLYDFYGELLTAHQRDIYERYISEDLSLGEIAVETGISRQGIHDLIRRCDKALDGYENKLQLVERFVSIRRQLSEILELSDALLQGGADAVEIAGQIKALSGQMLKEL